MWHNWETTHGPWLRLSFVLQVKDCCSGTKILSSTAERLAIGIALRAAITSLIQDCIWINYCYVIQWTFSSGNIHGKWRELLEIIWWLANKQVKIPLLSTLIRHILLCFVLKCLTKSFKCKFDSCVTAMKYLTSSTFSLDLILHCWHHSAFRAETQ